MPALKPTKYTAQSEERLSSYVNNECRGVLCYSQVASIAEELERKPASIIAKAKQLGFEYIAKDAEKDYRHNPNPFSDVRDREPIRENIPLKAFGPTPGYNDAMVVRLTLFVTSECGGKLNHEQAARIAQELGKKTTSVIAKIKSLGFEYVPKPKRRKPGLAVQEQVMPEQIPEQVITEHKRPLPITPVMQKFPSRPLSETNALKRAQVAQPPVSSEDQVPSFVNKDRVTRESTSPKLSSTGPSPLERALLAPREQAEPSSEPPRASPQDAVPSEVVAPRAAPPKAAPPKAAPPEAAPPNAAQPNAAPPDAAQPEAAPPNAARPPSESSKGEEPAQADSAVPGQVPDTDEHIPSASEESFMAAAGFDESDIDDPEFRWKIRTTKLLSQWKDLGLENRYWHYLQLFTHRLRTESFTIPAGTLFSEEDRQVKVQMQKAVVENRFLNTMRQKIQGGFVGRLLKKPQDSDLGALRELFAKKGRVEEFDAARAELDKQLEALESVPMNEMFSSAERLERLQPWIRHERHKFVRRQQRSLAQHRRYQRLVQSLTEDPIDQKIDELATQYTGNRGHREWIYAFDHLLQEIFDALDAQAQDENESPVRLIQNDFVILMQQRLRGLKKYTRNRRYTFDNEIENLIRRISFFESELIELLVRNAQPDEYFAFFNKFQKALSTVVSHQELEKRKHDYKPLEKEKLQGAWLDFKQISLRDSNVNDTFAKLRRIIKLSPRWSRELDMFKSEMLEMRTDAGGSLGADREKLEARRFIQRMVRQIDDEIDPDSSSGF